MRSPKVILCAFIVLVSFVHSQRISAQTLVKPKRIVIAASKVLDGKGHILRNTRIVV